MENELEKLKVNLALSTKDKKEEDLFSVYVSTEPQAKLPFTGPSASVGRTSSFATTTSTCGNI